MAVFTSEWQQIHKELGELRKDVTEIKQTLQYLGRWEFPTGHPYIVRVAGVKGGEPLIRGTGITVRRVVESTRLGMSPEEIADTFPDLSLSQIYDALSYYFEHKAEIDAYIAENEDMGERRT